MWKDPIVEEVRKSRAQLVIEWQNARNGSAGMQKAIFERWTGRKVFYEPCHRKQMAAAGRVAEGQTPAYGTSDQG